MSSIHNESGKYSFLWDLSDEELERLLQQEFIASDDRELDEDYFMAIVEVMKSRETVSPDDRAAATAAWKDFQENYMGQSDAYEFVPFPETKSSTINQIDHKPRTRRLHRVMRIVLIAALMCCILGGIIASATGWLERIVTWTSETFGFASPYDRQAPEVLSDDVYADLRDIMADYTNLAVVPNWAPEGTQMESEVRVLEELTDTLIKCRYKSGDTVFSITYHVYETMPEEYKTGYEKGEQCFPHEHDGTEFAISDNR